MATLRYSLENIIISQGVAKLLAEECHSGFSQLSARAAVILQKVLMEGRKRSCPSYVREHWESNWSHSAFVQSKAWQSSASPE